jgi:hypothetical protein
METSHPSECVRFVGSLLRATKRVAWSAEPHLNHPKKGWTSRRRFKRTAIESVRIVEEAAVKHYGIANQSTSPTVVRRVLVR